MNTNLLQKTVQPAQPKFLASGEGEMTTMLTHTFLWKVTGADTNGHYAMLEFTDTEGGSAPVHSHPWEETFYILEGEIEIQVDRQRQILGAGSVIHVPANAIHSFRVCSPTIRALGLIAPAQAEAFYRDMGTKITSLPPDPSVIAEVCARHQCQLYPA